MHALGTVDGPRRWRSIRHAAVASPKQRRPRAMHRARIDLVAGLMRPEAAVDIAATHAHRPVAHWARPPAAFIPTIAPPEHAVVGHRAERGHPQGSARVQLLDKLSVRTGWEVDQEPPGSGVL